VAGAARSENGAFALAGAYSLGVAAERGAEMAIARGANRKWSFEALGVMMTVVMLGSCHPCKIHYVFNV
jgi:hypothetical protein